MHKGPRRMLMSRSPNSAYPNGTGAIDRKVKNAKVEMLRQRYWSVLHFDVEAVARLTITLVVEHRQSKQSKPLCDAKSSQTRKTAPLMD